jgi:hypothetical protein
MEENFVSLGLTTDQLIICLITKYLENLEILWALCISEQNTELRT